MDRITPTVQATVAHSHGRGRFGIAYCLRQCRRFAFGRRGDAAKRDHGAAGARRQPLAARPPTPHRKRAPGHDRRALGLIFAYWGARLLLGYLPGHETLSLNLDLDA